MRAVVLMGATTKRGGSIVKVNVLMTQDLAANLDGLRRRLDAAERLAGRPRGGVRLMAVSKTQPAEALMAAYQLGLRDFGENYWQEALAKQRRLAHFDICWHFIGPIQSNKTRPIAAGFSWVHSVDRSKVAERLNEQRPDALPPLNVCIQVNVSGEFSKSGLAPEAVAELVAGFREWPRLRLRGLMAIPAPCHDFAGQRAAFRRLREIFERLPASGLDTLSMGMTDDLEAAICEGATIVRIGTALFGPRRV